MRPEYERILGTFTTFFGVLLAVAFAVGVSSNGALKGPDAFVLRWTVISLMVAFSALVAWLRWRFLLGRDSAHAAALPTPSSARVHALPVSTRAQQVRRSAKELPTGRQAIVFRQHFPPQPEGAALSFFGGAPVAPESFRWPRSGGGADGKPFTFLMQIDCAAVPPPARVGLLPARGVLYFFLDLKWEHPNSFRVLYEEVAGKDWMTVEPPADLPHAFGEHASSVWKWPQSLQDCPKLLPKWTFEPVALDVPLPAHDPAEGDEDEDSPRLWPGEKAIAEALRRAQGDDVVSNSFSVRDFIGPDRALRRLFANYPHDWRAVQICSGLVLEYLSHDYYIRDKAEVRDLSEPERNALVMRIKDEARSWFDHAGSQSPFTAVPRADSERFWAWLCERPWLVRSVMQDAVTMSIEASLVESREAARRIPSDVARRVHNRHALAVLHDGRLFTNIPDRMLAPPVDVQGNQWERAQTNLLLLELSSNEGLGHHFGEGVYQFWITAEDLKARRFDKVELTADAY